jgi:hypothetical protein
MAAAEASLVAGISVVESFALNPLIKFVISAPARTNACPPPCSARRLEKALGAPVTHLDSVIRAACLTQTP